MANQHYEALLRYTGLLRLLNFQYILSSPKLQKILRGFTHDMLLFLQRVSYRL